MTTLHTITLGVDDVDSAGTFYAAAFGLGPEVRLEPSTAPTTGFRGFTLSLLVSQPANADALLGAALTAGAVSLKPAAKSLWGYGGVVQAPDGTIWKVATSAKKDTGPATRAFDSIALLLGVADIKASKQFYVEHGLAVGKSFGSSYVEFAGGGPLSLGLYKRRALAKDAGVAPEGTGSHRIALGSDDTSAFTDPDGFAWEAASDV